MHEVVRLPIRTYHLKNYQKIIEKKKISSTPTDTLLTNIYILPNPYVHKAHP